MRHRRGSRGKRTWRGLGVTAAVAVLLAVAGTAMGGAPAGAPGAPGAPGGQRAGAGPSAGGPTLKTMTWNVCADTPHASCAAAHRAGEVAAGVERRMRRHRGLDAVFLQDICLGDYRDLRDDARLRRAGWHWHFTGLRDAGATPPPATTAGAEGTAGTAGTAAGACAGPGAGGAGQGELGIAVGVRAAAAFSVRAYPPADVPDAADHFRHWQVHRTALCAKVPRWHTTLCGTHLRPVSGKRRAGPADGSRGARRSGVEHRVEHMVGHAGGGPHDGGSGDRGGRGDRGGPGASRAPGGHGGGPGAGARGTARDPVHPSDHAHPHAHHPRGHPHAHDRARAHARDHGRHHGTRHRRPAPAPGPHGPAFDRVRTGGPAADRHPAPRPHGPPAR